MAPNDHSPENSPHDQIRLLLPWYVNNSLEAGEQERVQMHLKHCSQCREEVSKLNAFARRVALSPIPQISPRASYARLVNIIEQRRAGNRPDASPSSWSESIRQAFGHQPAFVGMASALILLLLILPFGVQQWHTWTEPRFHTLADSGQAAVSSEGDLRIVFDSALGPEQIDALLRSINGTRVAGPDASGVYAIQLSGSDHGSAAIETAIAHLRNQEGIVFVEPAHRP